MNSTNISNLSYTNKDFNSIYVELLEYAKKLSYKWDPSSSDESDPGLVLLKLAAIIGDKDCYNIDKNILELMPASVTQMPAARQLFEQCGYVMRYYTSATGDVNITIKRDLGDTTEDVEYTYTIPQFTMLTDSDSSVVYTTTKAVTLSPKVETSVEVIEGTSVKYLVNNDSLITMANLDSNNRLYFTETNIAENGIFITNVDSSNTSYSNYDKWQLVDNLQTQPSGKPCYKFGVTVDSSLCYLEFPEDIEFLMNEGLNITYILTSGSKGNVSSNKIKNFYVDTKFIRSSIVEGTTDVDATVENVTIRNPLPISNGLDPETIDEAYRNYKRVRDTFNTLVSLKDYTDYMITSGTASNGYVCDRTNDIQHSYKVVTTNHNNTFVKTVVEHRPDQTYTKDTATGQFLENESPVMTAFDLCVYALKYVPTVSSSVSFNESFQLTPNDGSFYREDDINSLQHDFLSFDCDKILMIKNKYPITANIVPRYKLSETEKFQVIYNVETALQKALNSNKINFGDAASIELIQETILNADERIKTLIDFESPNYETYAVFKVAPEHVADYGDFYEIRIDNESDDGGYVKTSVSKSQLLNGSYYIRNTLTGAFDKATTFDSSKTYYKYDDYLHDTWNNFRVEIFAKNVLAGVTPLYEDKNLYLTSVNQNNVSECSGISRITTNTCIDLTPDPNNDNMWHSSILRDNESILLTSPNFIEENNFSSYVKVLYFFKDAEKNDIISNESKVELGEGDFIIFFWKPSDTATYYNYIKYDSSKLSPAKFISPSGFNLSRVQDLSSSNVVNSNIKYGIIKSYFSKLNPGKGTTESLPESGEPFITAHPTLGDIKNATKFIEKCLINDGKNQVLTGTRIINMMNVNRILINNIENGCRDVYWILNNDTNVLFKAGQYRYTLNSGEYFLYTNDEKNVLYLLGEGTLIERSEHSDEEWSIPSSKQISYSDLLSEGIDILADKWYTLKKTNENDNNVRLWATEQQQILIGPGNSINLKDGNESPKKDAKFTVRLSENKVALKQGNLSNVSFISNGNSYNKLIVGVPQGSSTNALFYQYNIGQSVDKQSYVCDTNQVIDTIYRDIHVESLDDAENIQSFFKNHCSIDSTILLNLTNTETDLKGFGISYTDSSSNQSSVTTIESNEFSWSAKSILNINMSDEKPQTLYQGQSLLLFEDDSDDSTLLKGFYGDDNNYVPLNVLSSSPVYSVGGKDLNVKNISVESSLSFLTYTSEENIDDEVTYNLGNAILHVTSEEETTKEITFELLSGKYLLQVVPSENVTYSITLDNAESHGFERIQQTNTYRFNIVNSVSEEIKLIVTFKGKITDTLTILPLFKYEDENLASLNRYDTNGNIVFNFEENLLNRISVLDRDSEFNYAYRPSRAINLPLEAASFLKKDHFYNNFTICQWNDVAEDNITVHDVIR